MHQTDYEKILRMYCRACDESKHVACCLPCHMDYEERKIFQYLSPEDQAELSKQHEYMRANLNDNEFAARHIDYEMPIFNASGAPPEIIERIEADHLKHLIGAGLPVKFGNVKIQKEAP